MRIINVNSNPKNNAGFTGAQDRKLFRGLANNIIAKARSAHQMEYLEPFNDKANGPTLKAVLRKAIFEDAARIGRECIEKTDRALFGNLTRHYANFEEAETGVRPIDVENLTLDQIQI